MRVPGDRQLRPSREREKSPHGRECAPSAAMLVKCTPRSLMKRRASVTFWPAQGGGEGATFSASASRGSRGVREPAHLCLLNAYPRVGVVSAERGVAHDLLVVRATRRAKDRQCESARGLNCAQQRLQLQCRGREGTNHELHHATRTIVTASRERRSKASAHPVQGSWGEAVARATGRPG